MSQLVKPNYSSILICSDCKLSPPNLADTTEGDCICADCGLVLQRIIETSPEWRHFKNDNENDVDPSRVGFVGNDDDVQDLSTNISSIPGTSGELKKTQARLNKINIPLTGAYNKIIELCASNQLPKIVQDGAKEVYKLVYEEKSLKGKSKDSVIAASIFLGCRKAKLPRTFKEIYALTNVPSKEIGRVFKIVSSIVRDKIETDTHKNFYASADERSSQTSAIDLIRRFCSHLGLNNEVITAAEYLVKRCTEEGILDGRSPTTVTATVIYMACKIFKVDLKISKISEKTGVSGGTVTSTFKILFAQRAKLVDQSWTICSTTDVSFFK